MKADGTIVKELITIEGWSILHVVGDEDGESGIAHVQCDSWMQYSTRANQLWCRECGAATPTGIVTVWLFLNVDKPTASSYFKEEV